MQISLGYTLSFPVLVVYTNILMLYACWSREKLSGRSISGEFCSSFVLSQPGGRGCEFRKAGGTGDCWAELPWE